MKKILTVFAVACSFLLAHCSRPKSPDANPLAGYLTQTNELGAQTYTVLCANGTAHRIVLPAPGQPKDDAACTVPITFGRWEQIGESIKISTTSICNARGQLLSGQASGGIPSCTQSFGALDCENRPSEYKVLRNDIVEGSAVHERLPDQHKQKNVHRDFSGAQPPECAADWRPRSAAALMAYVKREIHH